ncbi:P-type conjugative transfer protein TrbG [Sphingomonas asaccharolytica]|uniref:P-type conjugative transfer protein TrbG n=1 Tax=Sphingomonas asaccharolytica TaxID=40681 RepID=UPI000A014B91|nr:P-type conjugative transfer protein TrbG [Sphingomonas asaccharolytica]
MKCLSIAPLYGLSLVGLCAAAETAAQTRPGDMVKPAPVADVKAPPVTLTKAAPPATRPVRHGHRSSAAEASVALANRAATLQPAAPGFVNAVQVYPFADGTLYQVYAAPEHVTDIALQPGEALVSVAAGDTVRWVIGDTTSGGGADKRTHILIKPFSAGLSTNLVIASDRRTYHLALASTSATAMVALSWTYPQDALIALKRAEDERQKAVPVATGIVPDQLHFDYAITGDRPAWRPLRAFDDGRQTFVEFPASLAVGEAPPLFLVDAKGQAQLVNYRLQGRFYVVDRLFDTAELRLGLKHQDVVRIERAPTGGRKERHS